MDFIKFCEEIDANLNKVNIILEEYQKKQLYEYMKNLIEWNDKINLTAIKDEKEIIIKHFVDSLYTKNLIEGKVIDIGSGAGLPGIPLKILKPEIKLVSIDSVNKKVNFQKDIVEKLNLDDIEILHVRAEELARQENYREKFDVAISRAVANMTTLVEYMLPFIKIGGKCLCLKGPNYEEEIDKSKKAIEILGGKIEKIRKYSISKDIKRSIIIIKKEKETPKKYPRNNGKPLKNPLF